jgi:peptidoglycan/LPS O-acetylase OafA/YrhL
MEPRAGNSFDFVRFCAASAVLFSHHFALAGLPEPPVPSYGEDFGKLAVEVFFCLSGFLICRSLQKSTDWASFISARFLRIFPNLTFALVTTSVVTLLWYGNYANLWPHAKYVIRNLLMFLKGVTYVIPGVFTDAHAPAVNGPLWSLPSELWLYALLFLIFIVGGRRSGVCILLGALFLSIVWGATPFIGYITIDPFDSFWFSKLGSFFLSGALLAVCWSYIENHAIATGAAALLAIIFIRNLLPIDTIFHSLALAAVVIGLGSSKAMAWFSKGGDASYGMYIFAWPVQQFCLLLIGPFWLSMLVAFLATAALGYATWHTFEKRAMLYRKGLAEGLRKMVFAESRH